MAHIQPLPQQMLFLVPQCVQTHVDSPSTYAFAAAATSTIGRNNAQNISPLNTTITPQSPTSKILITLSVSCELAANTASHSSAYFGAWYLVRNIGGTRTEIGSANSETTRPYGFAPFELDRDQDTGAVTLFNLGRSFVDTPNTTLPVTYELWAYSTHNQSGGTLLTINRTRNDTNYVYNPRTTSQMILQEFFS
jgi:hypothetical protein